MPARKRSTAPHKPAWQKTWLWETFEKRARTSEHARESLPIFTEWMKKLDTVLRKAGTAPGDFTLHDDEHALRVAHRMEQLLPAPVRRNLSDYELALLLLAAYGHDIGMTPAHGKVQQHYQFLFGHDTGLSPKEKADYQKFLDDYPDEPVTLPLTSSFPHLNLAAELTTHYVRSRHNDWSGQWLRDNLHGELPSLPDTVEILVRLCASHHWDFPRLRQSDFSPFLTTGSAPQLIHLRYLACILRLADILENDPERTPPIIMRHRGIGPGHPSLLYWQKDHALSISVQPLLIHFQARPKSALIHKALTDLADWIDYELQGIAALGGTLPPLWIAGKLKIERQWLLAPSVTRDIQPANASYEYIEGSFRPNTSRLLQLLSNEQLYGRPIVAVRELLQNAFDAVREKIARRRLEPHIPDPADSKWEQRLGDEEKVTLILRPGTRGNWQLHCEDTGTGLTKALITGHLLVSGQSRRHALLDLERRCAARGFQPGLTGQFGIGVLSYFMLAETLTFETTRYQGCGDNDSPGWIFTTRGVGSFGELSRLPASPFPTGGTRVIWQLRPDRLPDPAAFAAELLAYLKETLIRIPCRFEFKTEHLPGGDLHWQRPWGWTKTAEDWIQLAQSTWREPEVYARDKQPARYDDVELRDRREAEIAHYPEDLEAARKSLRCETLETTLPGQCAALARLVLFYFELPQGRSLYFPPQHLYREEFLPVLPTLSSWKGMACTFSCQEGEEGIDGESNAADVSIFCSAIEFDVLSITPALLAVSREAGAVPRPLLQGWVQSLQQAAEQFTDNVLKGEAGDYFREINDACLHREVSLTDGRGWYHYDEDSPFQPLQRPFAMLSDDGELHYHQITSQHQGKLVRQIRAGVALATRQPEGQRRFWLPVRGPSSGFSILAASVTYKNETIQIPAALWSFHAASGKIDFPPEWQEVALVGVWTQCVVLNLQNPLIRLAGTAWNDDWNYRVEEILEKLDATTGAQDAARWFLTLAANFTSSSFYDRRWVVYLKERRQHLLLLWKAIAAATELPFERLCFFAASGKTQLRFGPSGWQEAHLSLDAAPLLPPVTDPAWLLYAEEAGD